MSSNTQIRVEPRPTVYRFNVEEAVSLDHVLGPGGTKLLRETLIALPEIRRTLGDGVARQLDWVPTQNEPDCYRTNVNGVSIVLRLGGALARVSHVHDVAVYGSARPSLEPALQKAVNRKVNQLLAVAMTRRVSQQLKQYVGTRVKVEQKEQVRLSVANSFTLRAMAYVKAR